MTPRASRGLAILLLATAPVAAAPAPGDELRALRSKLEALKRDVAHSEGSRSEASDALRSSEQAISDANRRLAELAAEKQALDVHLQAVEQRQQTLGVRMAEHQRLAARLIYRQYTSGSSGPLQLLANGQDPNQVARTSVYLDYVAQARKTILAGLRDDAEALTALAEESAQRRQALAVNLDEQLTAQRELDTERQNRRLVLVRIASQLEQQRREVGALERDERRLTKLAEDLARLLAARKARPRRPSPERSPDRPVDGSAFEQLKGRLQTPVLGELVGRYGSPRADSGLSWRGLFIRAPAGRDVKAVAAGRVVFADWLRGFGNLLILDHGEGFMSLYGNNETLIGQIGDAVRSGQAVATVGSSGGNTATGLYFELRHQGKPFDPSSWIDRR